MPLITAVARLARRLERALRDALDAALVPVGVGLAWLDRRPTLRSATPIAEGALGPKVVVFCHYDRAGRIREDLR
ncbi:MAG TPA: hypothetical protein VMA86_07505, partial [Acetobacteraceae bacterium]|nr:hypothetical protein [Acetobacteraceae bacterium]